VTADELAVWGAVQAIYDGFLAGDRDTIDSHLAPDATIWDAFHEPLLRGSSERDARPPGGPQPVALHATDPVVDVYGDVAVVRHLLTAELPDGTCLRVRNTGVWHREGGGWLCVHNHEDLLA
jgi:ketosteroid isomerase-like protein